LLISMKDGERLSLDRFSAACALLPAQRTNLSLATSDGAEIAEGVVVMGEGVPAGSADVAVPTLVCVD
jgi:hypothetical protein